MAAYPEHNEPSNEGTSEPCGAARRNRFFETLKRSSKTMHAPYC